MPTPALRYGSRIAAPPPVSPPRRARRRWFWLPPVLALALVAGLVVYLSSAGYEGPEPPPVAPPSGGPTVWTTPVAALSPGDPRWLDRLIDHADVFDDVSDSWTTEFGFEAGNSYGVPFYDAVEATVRVEVRRKTNFPGFFNLERGETVPWNPDWRPSDGKDGYMVVRDSTSGFEWGYWNVSWWSHQTDSNSNKGCLNPDNLPPPLGDGYSPGSMLCAASAFQVLDPEGRAVDTRTYGGNFPGASGGGWHLGPLIVTPEQVASGTIVHALHFFAANTMMGPECAPERRAEIGETCGGAVAPAGQFEQAGNPSPPGGLATQVPEGTRFSIDVTDAQIDAWLDGRGYAGRLRETARIFAVALRDYGWFVGDTSPVAASWSVAGAENAADGRRWRELGITGTGKDLLGGLVDRANLRVWAPPTMTCADGSRSQWYCWASAGSYEG